MSVEFAKLDPDVPKPTISASALGIPFAVLD
jgi:hypothetical protein